MKTMTTFQLGARLEWYTSMNMVSKRFIAFFTLLLGLLVHLAAMQMTLSDDEIVLGQQQQQNVIVKNTLDRPLAVEVSVRHRRHSRDGVEDFSRHAENLIAIPPQMIIDAGKEQVVTLRWVGDTRATTEKAFRVVAENVPIPAIEDRPEVEDASSGKIKLTYRVVKSFYVLPKHDVKADLRVSTVKPIHKAGQKRLAVLLENKGKRHQIVRQLSLRINQGKRLRRLDVSREDLRNGINVLAGESQWIDVPWPSDFGDSRATGRLISASDY